MPSYQQRVRIFVQKLLSHILDWISELNVWNEILTSVCIYKYGKYMCVGKWQGVVGCFTIHFQSNIHFIKWTTNRTHHVNEWRIFKLTKVRNESERRRWWCRWWHNMHNFTKADITLSSRFFINGLYFIFPLIIFYRSITPVFSSFVTINRMTGECKRKKTHSAQSPVETYNGSMCLWKSQHARAILFISRDQSGFVEQVCDCICFLCIPASSLVVDNVFPLFVSLSIIFNAR